MRIITLMLLFIVAAATVFAFSYVPVYISGTVTDENYNGVPDATVKITCQDGRPQYELTGVNGAYETVFFIDNPCYVNDVVYVEAAYAGLSGTASGVVCMNPQNCPVPVRISDMTVSELTMIGAVFIALSGLGIIAYRRRAF
jgi:hypothetical protein